MEPKNQFTWINYYTKFADRLLAYKDNRRELLTLIKEVFEELKMHYPFMDNKKPVKDICPFTVFGCFNKGITEKNRIALMEAIGNKIGVEAERPTDLDGIPILNNLKAWFFGYETDRKPDDISNLWDLFAAGIAYADEPTDARKIKFVMCYDKVKKQLGIKWNLTMGLYWMRPHTFITLDGPSRNFITRDTVFSKNLAGISTLKRLPDAKTYLGIMAMCGNIFKGNATPYHSFPELSYAAWEASGTERGSKKISDAEFLKWFGPLIDALKILGGSATPAQVRKQIIKDLNLSDEVINETRGKSNIKKFNNDLAFARDYLVKDGYIDGSIRGIWSLTVKGQKAKMTKEIASDIFKKWQVILEERRNMDQEAYPAGHNVSEKRYWIYAPGNNASKWPEFYAEGIMGIGWEEMGNLEQYASKDEMKTKMKELYGKDYSYMNMAHATWQFANELEPGDIVYAKKGLYKIVGKGVIESGYIYDAKRAEYAHIRKVKWTHNGEWEHPGQAVAKTLTDITPYTDYLQKLESLFVDDNTLDIDLEDKEVVYDAYTARDFLNDVFMGEKQYFNLVNILNSKKNIILQGAPGVGKTYIAKRLAYSMMGVKDTSRVMMIQFHQSYSYEDFIMGFRPARDGFELKEGPFYQFCKTALNDDERSYYFIIDEINRGNLSKIFGELLMLIEKDKRGEKLRLLYANELFSVPKNVHIIGMMNTADRSLAFIDYALRRRFAFFELEPAFDSAGFRAIVDGSANPRYKALVEQVKDLNDFISKDESLGNGFRIGHSYLCPGNEVTDEWLAEVVNHELIPLLCEYWFDEQSKIEQWSKKLCGALDD